MRFKKEWELQRLDPGQLEAEKAVILREMKSPRFAKDPTRQKVNAKPTDPDSPEVEEPTMKQLEDYIALIDKVTTSAA